MRRTQRGGFGRRPVPKKPRLKLTISKGLEKLRELPEGTISLPDQTVLRRMHDIVTGAKMGVLKQTDLVNLQRIAKKHRIEF
ncbi:hypothetical protein CL629_02980 [bacterium]|nr:hypothetical protein [bacterium]|tara:strand:+ start:535 stop:780 length:246 start_codon:yes stop_codon:yes gene_type:complete